LKAGVLFKRLLRERGKHLLEKGETFAGEWENICGRGISRGGIKRERERVKGGVKIYYERR